MQRDAIESAASRRFGSRARGGKTRWTGRGRESKTRTKHGVWGDESRESRMPDRNSRSLGTSVRSGAAQLAGNHVQIGGVSRLNRKVLLSANAFDAIFDALPRMEGRVSSVWKFFVNVKPKRRDQRNVEPVGRPCPVVSFSKLADLSPVPRTNSRWEKEPRTRRSTTL